MKTAPLFLLGAILALFMARRAEAAYAPGEIMSNPAQNDPSLRRGERLNNPGNIRHSASPWLGKSADQPDSAFVKFDAPEYGLRAASKLLLNYQRLHGLNTVRGIINRWAPPSDNNPTSAYVAFVSQRMGVLPDTPLDLVREPDSLASLVAAIVEFEQGRNIYAPEMIAGAAYQATA